MDPISLLETVNAERDRLVQATLRRRQAELANRRRGRPGRLPFRPRRAAALDDRSPRD